MAVQLDSGVQTVLDNMQIVVGSEGGSLEIVEAGEDKLTVKYHKGVNEECPECVPNHDLVRQMFQTSLGIYAPNIRNFELT
jgi:hypothetical protein